MINGETFFNCFRFIIITKDKFCSTCITDSFFLWCCIYKMVCCSTSYTCAASAHTLYNILIRNIYIIECCTEGLGTVEVNGRVFPVQAGDCYILLPGDTVVHTADPVTPRRGYWCAMDGLRAGRYLSMAGIRSDAPFAPPEAFELIAGQLEQLFRMREESDPGADLRRSACMYAIFGELLRRREAAVDRDSMIKKAVSIMEARYDQPLTVEELASDVGLERCYFSTLFKAGAGSSPHQYL